MDTFEQIKKFLEEGGRCLLIENGKPIGVVLTMEEYELLQEKPQTTNHKSQTNEINPETEKLLIPRINNESGMNPAHSIGAAMVNEIEFPEASANIDEINLANSVDVTLEDLGLDELPY